MKAENFQVLSFVFLQTRRRSQGSSTGSGGITVKPAQRDPQEPPVSFTQSSYYVSKPVLNLRFEAINFNKFVAASVDFRLCVVGLGDLLPVVRRGKPPETRLALQAGNPKHAIT